MHRPRRVSTHGLAKETLQRYNQPLSSPLSEYAEESSLIPKNTSLTIARIPLANQGKKQWNPQEDANANAQRKPDVEQVHVDLSRMNGSEEDKIAAMIMQSTMDYDPTK